MNLIFLLEASWFALGVVPDDLSKLLCVDEQAVAENELLANTKSIISLPHGARLTWIDISVGRSLLRVELLVLYGIDANATSATL